MSGGRGTHGDEEDRRYYHAENHTIPTQLNGVVLIGEDTDAQCYKGSDHVPPKRNCIILWLQSVAT